MEDSRIRMSRWLLLVATVIFWASVAITVASGAGVPWLIVAMAVLSSAMAALVWTKLS